MRKSLPSSLCPTGKIIIVSKKIVQKVSLIAFVILFMAGYVSAQQLQPGALRQIQSLMDEKASRTPTQKKISSQLLYASKMEAGQRISGEVATLRTSVVKETDGRVKVDITATVTSQLVATLTRLGCEIIFSSERFETITAKVPLNILERVAELNAVRHIEQWLQPVNNNPYRLPGDEKKANGVASTTDAFDNNFFFKKKNIPDFNTRLNNVKKELNKVLANKEFNPSPFFLGSVTSEADATHKVDIARSVFNVTGAGIKIGVLSDGITGLATSQASGDLPATITILPDQAGNTGSEGRAMMELIYDLAPGAELYFATAFISQASFAQNILDLRAAGCDIIVDDVNYFAEGVFQDDNIARAVNTVTASGALYFSSAGNSGNKNDNTSGVWEGDYVDGGLSAAPIPLTGNLHNFGGGTLFNVLTQGGRVTLKWSDPLGLSGNDYDLFVTNSAGTGVVAAGVNIQNGNDNPYEDVGNCLTGERIYILKKTAAAPRALHLNTNRGMLTFNTPGVMYGHNAVGSAYTVAATPASVPNSRPNSTTGPFPNPFNSTNKVEVFSSDGPRRMFYNPDGTQITPGNILFATNGGTVLQKPDITAADGTLTATPGFIPFFGTSAAAPHAAAIAALVKSAVPGITPAQVRAALIASAIDIEQPGFDRDAGAGIIMAYEALVSAGATTPYAYLGLGTVTINEGGFSNSNGILEPGELGSMIIQMKNLSPNNNATGVTAVLTSATPGVTITQNTANYGNIASLGNSINTATPFIIGIGSSVPCGALINFTLTVTYSGGETAQKLFTLNPIATGGPTMITAALGSPPPTGAAFVSTSGTQTNRLNRTGVIPTCAASKPIPNLQEAAPGTLKAYHAYTFTNPSATSQCVTVSISSASVTSLYQVVYGNGGYNPAAIRTNYLADQGTTTNTAPFSFNAPAGQQFTVVVHEITTNGGLGINYNLNVNLNTCVAPPPCTPILISPATVPGAVVGTAYSQAITATGGSGAYLYSLTGTLPNGLTLSPGGVLSGTPTQPGSFPITVTATDATGCTGASQNYILNVILPTLTINDVTLNEGNSGTTTYTFTVSLSSPAGAGGVSFDIGTADNTATSASGDYVAKSLTGQTIPEGSTTYSFDVTVNGDLAVEPDESFFVNVSNLTGASASDVQGLGTITNDDITVSITVATSPAGREFSVDGIAYTSSQSFNWVPGTLHTISTTSPQNGGAGTKHVFSNWSDAGAISHSIITPSDVATYTANFTTQYLLTTSAGCGGSISPATGYYNAGTVAITATPDAGYSFTGFSGDLTGLANPQNITLNGPKTVSASFSVLSTGVCPSPHGAWKNSNTWPVCAVPMRLGTVNTYTMAQLRVILNTPVRSDASIILAYQLIAAKLNIANGALASIQVLNAINDADAAIGTRTIPADIKTNTALGKTMTSLATTLEQYNNGQLNGGCNLAPSMTRTTKQPLSEKDVKDILIVQSYPNPFSSVTTIRYSLPVEAQVNLSVFNHLGQKVAVIINSKQMAGMHQAKFNAVSKDAGIYMYQLLVTNADGKTEVFTGKMTLIK